MIDRRELAQDLRAHAHEVPEHIGRIMRAAAAELDRVALDFDAEVLPPPFSPPSIMEREPCN